VSGLGAGIFPIARTVWAGVVMVAVALILTLETTMNVTRRDFRNWWTPRSVRCRPGAHAAAQAANLPRYDA